MVEPRGKTPRRAEVSNSGVPFGSAEASSSGLPQASGKRCSNLRAAPRENDRGRTLGRQLDDDAAQSTRTMDPDERRKNDDN